MRCHWAERSEVERRYHDTEWGVVLHDDSKLFEQLTLRGAQAGLSFRTVLAKRAGYRTAFHDYDIQRIACMTDADIDMLMRDRSVIRNRLKLMSVRTNARASLHLIERGGSLSRLLWSMADDAPSVAWIAPEDVPARTDASDRLSSELGRHGFRFAGTAICYSLMQSAGVVNDHLADCPFRCRTAACASEGSFAP